jgi:peptidoglycan hydrolase-like protein with peptidoglycan-binding domain
MPVAVYPARPVPLAANPDTKEHSMTPFRTAIGAAAVALALASPTAFARDNSYVDATTIRQVQQTLQNRGFRAGPVDGVMGPATRTAVKQFQQSQNLETTGQLNRQTLVALGVQPDTVSGANPRVEAYGPATIRKVQQTLNNRGFQAGPVDGTLGASLQAALKDFQKSENLEPTGVLNQQTLAALGLPSEPVVTVERRAPVFVVPPASATVRQAQQALNQRGFNAGPADGVMGDATTQAVRNFQSTANLQPTGRLDQQTLSALGV